MRQSKTKKKEHAALNFFEPIILYLVLFFRGFNHGAVFGADGVDKVIPFSASMELSRLLYHSIPALALIWYLVIKKKCIAFTQNDLKPKNKDLFSFLVSFPLLLLTGAIVAHISAEYGGLAPPRMETPVNITGWIVLIVSCTATGYLEESFFRFYLLQKLKEWISIKYIRIIFSVFLFAVCHAYAGPFGILNAIIAGIFLCIVFERWKSLHGIALAHGFYNFCVYLLMNIEI